MIDQGQTFIGGYTDKAEMKAPCEPPVIVFGDHTKVIKYINFDFVAGADGVRAIKPLNAFFPKLFYYFLQAIDLPEKGYARHFQFLEKSFIPIPPLPEQHRIVAKIEELFTRLDAGVESLKKIKAQLERYRQAVLKHAFEGKLTAEWRQAHKHELEPASVLLERIKQERQEAAKGKYRELPQLDTSDLPELPEGWVWTRIGEVESFIGSGITPRGGRNVYVSSGIPFIRSQNVYPNGLHLNDIVYITPEMNVKMQRTAVHSGDVLLNITGASIGRSTFVPNHIDTANVNQHVCIIRIEYGTLPTYMSSYLNSTSGQSQIWGTQGGVTRQGLNYQQVRLLRFPICSLPEQQQVVAEIERRFSVADEIEKTVDHSLKQAERLRQSILKRAFEGRLVPQDPNDEPAEKLLERIKAEKAKRLSEDHSRKKNRTRGTTKQMRLV